MVQALAENGASLVLRSRNSIGEWITFPAGSTPLHMAAMKGDFDIVRLLMMAYAVTLSCQVRCCICRSS